MIALVGLVGASFSYAFANLVQTAALRRRPRREEFDPSLLVRLVANPLYCAGFLLQVLAFVLAFYARGSLPLYLVQAGTSASLGLTALLGAALMGWRIRVIEITALVVMGSGLVLLVLAAKPSTARPLAPLTVVLLMALLAVAMLSAWPAARLGGIRGAIALGVGAGLAFGVLAVASRPLAALPATVLPMQPTFWLVVLAAVIGQLLLATAFQRGHTTATAAGMEAMSTMLSAVGGIFLLADEMIDGRAVLVPGGLILVVLGVVVLARSMARVELTTSEVAAS